MYNNSQILNKKPKYMYLITGAAGFIGFHICLELLKKNEIIIVAFIYAVLFIVGILSYQDFGISVDEWELRLLGFANLKYIMGIFFQNHLSKLDQILLVPETWDYYGTHGAIFALPMAFIEYFFNITDSQKYYYIRHYFNHLIFLISNFYFFLLVKERFNNWIYRFSYKFRIIKK